MSDTPGGSSDHRTLIHVVAAIIVAEEHVLIAQRPQGSPHPLFWELPGGKVEPSESAQQALARELWEELGVRVKVGAFLGETVHRYCRESVRLEAYWVRHFQGRPRALHHRQVRWVAPERLGVYRFTEADVPLVRAATQELTGR